MSSICGTHTPMARSCNTCNHPKREEIERKHDSGMTIRNLAGRYEGVSRSGLSRHFQNCTSENNALAQIEKPNLAPPMVGLSSFLLVSDRMGNVFSELHEFIDLWSRKRSEMAQALDPIFENTTALQRAASRCAQLFI